MVDSVFLKSPRRIEALMMVMTLCLLVYNVAQYRLRVKLRTKGETLPNQLNKEVQNPNLRWISRSSGRLRGPGPSSASVAMLSAHRSFTLLGRGPLARPPLRGKSA
jgi:hypothetical protein